MNFVTDIVRLLGTPDLWHASLQYAALLLLPALGGVISERSGVVNIAMEGMMLTGAFFAVVVDLAVHNVLIAVLAAMVAGGLMASIHAVVSIRYRADQIVSGVAINIFAAGITVFLLNRFYGLADVGQVASREMGTPPPGEVRGHPLADRLRLADVDHAAFDVAEQVDARLVRELSSPVCGNDRHRVRG